jgi:hypothetical protein
MGTLILIITGMTQIGLASPKQRVEVDALDVAKKSPVYVECRKDGVLIHPDDPTSGTPVFRLPSRAPAGGQSVERALGASRV